MRKKILVLILAVSMLLILTSCVKDNLNVVDTTTGVAQNNNDSSTYTPVEINGTEVELDYLRITVLDGWKTMDVSNGIQIYKGSEVLQINLEGYGQSEEYVETYIETAISNNDGTDKTSEYIWGLEFLHTSYQVSGYYQQVYARLYNSDGQMLIVKMANLSTADIPEDIHLMLNSVVLK